MDFLTYAHHNNKTVKDIEAAVARVGLDRISSTGAVDALQFLRWVSQAELAKIPGAEDAPGELCTDPDRLDDYGLGKRPGLFDFLPSTARPGRRRIGPADVAVRDLTASSSRLLVTILLGNNVVNILGASVASGAAPSKNY